MKIKDITDNSSPVVKAMNSNSPTSITHQFEIDNIYNFVRTYDLMNKEHPYHFSISRKDQKKITSDELMRLITSEIVNQDLLRQFPVQVMNTPNKVTHLFPQTKTRE